MTPKKKNNKRKANERTTRSKSKKKIKTNAQELPVNFKDKTSQKVNINLKESKFKL